MSKVGLFGGSFDPIHQGHIKLALKSIEVLSLDEVWFIVAYDQPLKEGHSVSFEDRVSLLEIATEMYPQLKVITLEQELPKPSYTFNTVSTLKVEYDHEFVWILGSDNLETLDQWYRIEELKQMIDFVFVTRDDDVIEGYPSILFDDDASSTAIRHGQFKYLDPKVRAEIYKKHLYQDDFLFFNLSDKRANHVKRCVEVALEIAQYYDFDLTKVYQAVVLHDITKEMDKECELELMETHFKEYIHYHHKVYHQFTGAYVAKTQYMIEDEDVLVAIMHHTTGTDDGPLSKLLYVADKVERGRPYNVEGYIKLAKENLDLAFKTVKEDAEKHRKEGK